MTREQRELVDGELENLLEDDFLKMVKSRQNDLAELSESYFERAQETGDSKYLDVAAVLFLTSRILSKLSHDRRYGVVVGSDTLQ